MPRLLIIDDDPAFCTLLRNFLNKQGFETSEAYTAREGIRAVYDESYNLVLIDYRLPDMDGLELLKNIKKRYFHLPVIIMTNYANIKTAVKAMQLGAFEYVTKPINPDEIRLSIKQALAEKKPTPEAQPRVTRSSIPSFSFVEGASPRALEVKKHIDLVAPTNISVIVQGESGTGKRVRIAHDSPAESAGQQAVRCARLRGLSGRIGCQRIVRTSEGRFHRGIAG